MTVTKNRFSSSSCIAPDIEPIAQHSFNYFVLDNYKLLNSRLYE